MSHQTSTKNKTTPKSSLDKPWQVVALNDSVNLMSYVTMVFQKTFGFDQNKATKHMMEVHEKGRSIVWSGEREHAELYSQILHQWQLNSIIQKDA